jgi:TP901 family phage tail tape measure protein
MAEDANARIRVDIDTAAALANIKNLQRQISAFHTSMAKGGAAAAATSLNMQQGLLNSINQTGKFSATIKNVKSTTDSFTDSLQKNKLSMGEYFRYAGASTKTFGRFFRTEFETINKVARERVKDLQTQYIKMGRDANGAMRAIAVRPLALDMENLATKTQIATQRQALLNQLLKQGSTNLLNFGKNTQWAGRQLMVGFTIPLVMFGSVASKTFMDVEKQAVRFKRVYGEMFTTTQQADKALQDIKNLGNEFTKYGIAVSKTMELAADIAAMGKMGAELNAQVAETTRLAVLGGVEQSEALQATISLTDAFGISADELAGKVDFLNAVENQTVTSIEDLTIAIPKAGPVVRQLGGDVEDLTFFLTAMREGGINASEGANALKSGLASLINPTRQASEMLRGFGINITGIVEANAGDVKGLVLDFATALDTLDPLNRARAIEQLFGKFQFSRLSTLFQNVIKEGNQASRVLALTNATTEELAVLSEREMRRIEDSPMFKFQKAIEDIKVTLVPLGEAFLKAVTPLLEFGTSILKKFNELDDGAKGFVVSLTAIAGVIGPVFLMGFGLIANGVANVIKMFAFFKASMNKTGSASTQLGMQTEYMTQQQLEASAVAASLDQVHTKLRQTFTSEAAAVDALTAAYRRSAAAQLAMTGGAISRTRPPGLKLASGIISVPGPKGAGDVVPAMLSPGEAVIPAKQAQKYSGFISSMIADNVPGFRFGRNPFAKMKSAIQPENSKYGVGEGLLRLMTGNRLGPFGSEPNFWQDSIANRFARSNPKIAVRMQDKDLLSLIASKDKRYKSVFETKKSNAGDSQKERAYAEEKLFGLPQDIDPSKRPTYGYMFKQERGQSFIGRKKSLFNMLTGEKDRSLTRSAYQNLFKSGTASLMNKKTFRYGNAAMVLKNRNIKDRTTFTYGDSYNRSLDRFGTPAKLGTRNKDQIKASYTSKDKDFFEAQIMGGFTLKDVKKIVVTEPHLIPLLQQALRQQGLKIPVGMPKFTMLQRLRSIVSNAGLYGTTLNAQGNRINHRYQNSELPITQKDGSYGIKEERYIRRRTLNNPPTELNLAARLFQKLGVPGYEGGTAKVKKNKAIVAFGAHQPFTTAHQDIARLGMSRAAAENSDFMQFTTNQGKSKRSIIDDQLKTKLIAEALGINPKFAKNPFDLMRILSERGIRDVELLLGEDRMGSKVWTQAAKEYGINLKQTGIPRPDGSPSGTAARAAAAANDKKQFNQLLAKGISPQTRNQVFQTLMSSLSKNKFASGILSVPGPKGAGDVVPSMLSPGEAVIPSKPAKKHRGLIQGIIADNIPGFEDGPGLITVRSPRTENTHLSSAMDINDPDVARQVEIKIPGFSRLEQSVKDLVEPLSDLVSVKPNTLNQAARSLEGMSADDFERQWASSPEGLRQTIRRAESAGEMIVDEASDALVDGMDADIGRRTAQKIRSGAGDRSRAGWLDRLIAESTNEVVEEARRSSDPKVRNVGEGLAARGRRVATVRTRMDPALGSEDAQLKSLVDEGKARKRGSFIRAVTPDGEETKLQLGRPSYSNDEATRRQQQADLRAGGPKADAIPWRATSQSSGFFANQAGGTYEKEEGLRHKKARLAAAAAGTDEANARIEAQRQTLGREQNDLIKMQRSRLRGSPHPQAAIDGKDDAKLYSKANREQLTKEEKYVRSLQSNYGGAQVVTPEMRGTRKQVEKLEKQDRFMASQAKARAREVANQQRIAAAQNQAMYGTTTFTPEMRQERKRLEAAAKAANAPAAAQRKLLATQNAAAIAAQKQADAVERQRVETARINAEQKQERSAARKERYAGISSKVAGGASMAGMGAMMYGMSGGPGAEIAMMASMPLMMAPMLGKLAPVVLGLTALAAGVFALKDAFDSAEKAARESTLATGASTQSITAFAEFAGKASAGEIMDKRRANALDRFGVQSGKETFGNLFLQSEAAKPILDGLMASVKQGTSSENMVATTKNQLATAVASGALSKTQAASIAASLGEAIGDRTFGIKVIGELNELIGIDGSNLLENPIEVRVKLIEETNSKLRDMANSSALPNAQGQQVLGAGVGIAGGIGGVKIGAVLGAKAAASLAGAAANAVRFGTAIARVGALAGPVGIVAGTIVGAATGAIMLYDGLKKAGAAAGAMSAQGVIALQQNQEMLDSLDLEYEKRIAVAKAAGDLAKANELIAEQESGRQQILTASRETIDLLVNQYKAAGPDIFNFNPFRDSIDKTLNSMYQDDPLMQQVMTGSKSAIEGSSATGEQQYTLKLMLASGNVDPGTMTNLMAVFGDDQDAIEKIVSISLNLGSADAGRAFALASLFEDEVQKKEFLARIETKVPIQARKVLDVFETVQKAGGVLEMEAVLNAYMADEDAGDELIDQLAEFKARQEEGPITSIIIQEVFGRDAMNAVMKDWEYFSNLDRDMQTVYMTLVKTAFETIENDPGAYNAWAAVQKAAGKDYSKEAYAHDTGFKGTTEVQAMRDLEQDMAEDPGGGSGGPAASSLDEILKKLRDVRKNQVGVLKGFEASAAAINKLFGGGAGINLFSGIENDMRRLGAEEDLIDLIVGMDPEEFEKQKNTLFNFDKQTGEIIGFKDQLQNVGRALSAIALGQYVSDQQKSAKESRNQVLAFNQLRAAGYSVADAYEAVQDASVASAIATGNFTREQMATMLQELKAAQAAMKEAARLTPEGLQEVFEDGFSKAMEAFDVKERKLTLEYEFKIKDDQALVTEAQNQIASIQYELDDYEADLRRIEIQEEAINKTYDTKLEALEKVRVANQKVLDQEKGRLSVAEAITRGDLAATARAVQDLRQTSASGYFSSQTDALNAGRQSALDQVRDSSGLSRIEIEEKIKKLTNDIFNIEEDTLEPAQRRIDLATIELEKRLSEEKVLERTKGEWEQIKNNIDFARVNSAGYKSAMDEALAVVQDVLDAWNEIEKPKQTIHTIVTVREGDITPYAPDGPGGDPDDDDPVPPAPAAPVASAHGKKLRTAMNSNQGLMNEVLKLSGADHGSPDSRDAKLANYIAKVSSSKVDELIAKHTSVFDHIGNYVTNWATAWWDQTVEAFSPWGKAAGGLISGPGTGTSDSVPTMLSNGEYVIKASTVKQFGTKMFDNLNAGSLPVLAGNMSAPRFASLGSTASVNQSSVSSRQAAAPSSNSVYNYNLSVNVASQSDPNAIAQTVMAQLQRVDSQRVRNGRF